MPTNQERKADQADRTPQKDPTSQTNHTHRSNPTKPTNPTGHSNQTDPTNQTDQSDREIVLSRLFNAPRELVFDVWTNPEHVMKWWGPAGFTNTLQEMDLRPGGIWRYIMHGPDGTDYPNRCVFMEIVAPERLVYSQGTGLKNEPDMFIATVTFEAQGDKTLLTMRSVFTTAALRKMVVTEFHAIEGGIQHLEKLAAYLVQLPAGSISGKIA